MSVNLIKNTALVAEATEIGHVRGWEHAAYTDAYGVEGLSEMEIPGRFASVAAYYSSAYAEGMERFHNDQYSDGTPCEA